jgi:hypothetical protein
LKNTFIQVLAKALLLLAKVALPVLPFALWFYIFKTQSTFSTIAQQFRS